MKFRIIFVLLVLLACFRAEAATYYVAACDTGAAGLSAAGGCQPGDDSSVAPTNPLTPWRTVTKVRNFFNTAGGSGVQCGDVIKFAMGGLWSAWGGPDWDAPNARTGTGCRDNPIVFDSYSPTLWTSSTQPILQECTSGNDGFRFSQGSSSNNPDGGYTLRNLRLDGCRTTWPGSGGENGIVIARSAHNVTVENMTVTRWSIGLQAYGDRAAGEVSHHCIIRGSSFISNTRQGILFTCDDSLVENNTFDLTAENCTDQCYLYHHVYGSGSDGYRFVFRNNDLYRNSHQAGKCASPPFVFHGKVRQLDIYNNTIREPIGEAEGSCWAIAVDGGYASGYGQECFRLVRIFENKVINAGGLSIAVRNAPYVEIHNNTIVQEAGANFQIEGITLPDNSYSAEDCVDTGASIIGNSMYVAAVLSDSKGIDFAAGAPANAGSSIKVANNLIFFGSGSSNHLCYDTQGLTLASFTVFNNNLCYHAGGNGTYSQIYSTLANAQAAGFDVNGSAANPLIVTAPTSGNGWKINIQSGSPARNAGNATYKTTHDAENCTRGATNDIGAYPYRAVACTPTPQPVGIAR